MKIELLNEDCMVVMSRYPDNHFDLAITDPPYFKIAGSKIFPGSEISTTGVKRNRFESKEWKVPGQFWLDELVRISKHQIIWGINYMPFSHSVGRIVWDKMNDHSSFSKCEIASASMHYGVHQFRYLWNGMLQGDMKNKEKRIHPTQKPVKLYEWLLSNYAKEGDRILDTHLGSGSSAIAAYNMKFDFVGTELDKDYYIACKERFNQHTKQFRMF